MAIITCFAFPALQKALDRFFLTELNGSLRKDLKWVTSYTFENIHLAGRFSASKDGERLLFTGVVTFSGGHNSDTFIYTGKWNGNVFEMESLMCELFSIKNHLLTYDDKEYELATVDYAETAVDIFDNEFVRLEKSKVEFPLLPGRYARLLGPDGDYVELDVEVCPTESSKPILELNGVKIYRITRSFSLELPCGDVAKAYLDAGADHRFVRFQRIDGSDEKDVGFLCQDLLAWLGEKTEHRNLLRALRVNVPSFTRETKKAPTPSTTLATATAS